MEPWTKKKRITGYILMMGMLMGTLIMGVFYGEHYRIQQQLAEKVIRFHVLANSDSTADQHLKLQVRDAVGAYMYEKMPEIESRENCEEMILQWIPEIIETAEKVVAEAGYSYEVKAALTNCDFPVKSYGTYTFPAGKYEALQIVIGEGDGANWWCVMYPNMCFENSMYKVDEETGKILRTVLDEEEYEAVLASGKYQVRFKFLEQLQRFF